MPFCVQVIKSEDRLGAKDKEGYPSIRGHPLFTGLDFDSLHEMTPPKIAPNLPHTENEVCLVISFITLNIFPVDFLFITLIKFLVCLKYCSIIF